MMSCLKHKSIIASYLFAIVFYVTSDFLVFAGRKEHKRTLKSTRRPGRLLVSILFLWRHVHKRPSWKLKMESYEYSAPWLYSSATKK